MRCRSVMVARLRDEAGAAVIGGTRGGGCHSCHGDGRRGEN